MGGYLGGFAVAIATGGLVVAAAGAGIGRPVDRAALAAAQTAQNSAASASGAHSMAGMAGMSGNAPAANGAIPAVVGTATTTTAAADAYWSQVAGAPYQPTGVVRTYFVEADEVDWNYAPTGSNQITGKPWDDVSGKYTVNGPGRIGATYTKCLYREYTDATYTTLKPRAARDAYQGFIGPIIRAEVGDTIKVVYKNTCTIPTSVHPHGVFYQKASEGAPYADNTSGKDTLDDAVPQGGKHTYTWLVPERAGPGPGDGSSAMWMYHSHTDEVGDTYAGLMGFMEVTARGMARPDGSPKDVDREVFELFSVMNENNSPYLQQNVTKFAQQPYVPVDDPDFYESNLMHSINGYVFGNQPMLTLKKGERVRWYLMDMGTEVDLHTPHWHGNDVVTMGSRMDVVNLLPASMVTADMVPDNPGIWLFHCHVNDHLTAGMVTRYQVVP
jgi:manganese oxidase